MALPERTLCWVEGPPWDRSCEPVGEAPDGRLYTEADVLAIVDEALMANVDHFSGQSMEDILAVLIVRAEEDKAPMSWRATERADPFELEDSCDADD